MAGRRPRQATRANEKKIAAIEDKVLVQYILNCDFREYLLSLKDVEDKAD